MSTPKIGWRTIAGALVWTVGQLSSPDVLAVLPGKVAGVITALGGLLTVFGIRKAIQKTEAAAVGAPISQKSY